MSTFADPLGTTRADAPKGVSVPWLPLVPLLAIPILGTTPERLELVVLGVQAIFLLMAAKRYGGRSCTGLASCIVVRQYNSREVAII